LGKAKIPNIIYKVTSDTTRVQMLQTGEIDMDMVTVNQDNVKSLQDAGFLDLSIFPTNGYGYIGFNMNDAKFKDVKVRQALAYGLNRAEIVEASFAGGYADVINEPQSKESWAYSKGSNDYAYDKEKAAKLLDEAGWKVGDDGIREKDGVKFEIKFTASTPNSVNDAIIPVAKANYEEIGIKFEAEQMDFNAVREQVNSGKAQMFFMAWGLTPKADATGVFGTNGAQNKTAYSNTELDALFVKGLQETDVEKRKAIYKEIYDLLNEDLPYIFMYQRRDMWAINSRVKGFEDQITPYKKFTQSLYKLTLE
ncbi:MAG: ABC transporter substrate-binding protein, partial [Clostridium sp.]